MILSQPWWDFFRTRCIVFSFGSSTIRTSCTRRTVNQSPSHRSGFNLILTDPLHKFVGLNNVCMSEKICAWTVASVLRENFAVWLRQNPEGVPKFQLSRGNVSRSSFSVNNVLTVLKSTGKCRQWDGEPRLDLVCAKQLTVCSPSAASAPARPGWPRCPRWRGCRPGSAAPLAAPQHSPRQAVNNIGEQ